jgi:hypothetical protein
MNTVERLEAIGSRGEACIILKRAAADSQGEDATTYTLASGERLAYDPADGTFMTLDSRRVFRLRQA